MEYQQNVIVRQQDKVQQATLISKVYFWMCIALVVTGLTAFFAVTSETIFNLVFTQTAAGIKPSILFYILIFGELGLVFYLSAAINRMSSATATAVFLIYSVINGLTLSVVLLAYTGSSIATTFFVTAGTFAVMSAYGYFTKQDLTSWGRIFFMALIGIIIASIVNIFLGNGMLDLIISFVGVIVFVGLVAYDTQKIKMYGGIMEERKAAIMGALALYLDFINLFLFLLRALGNRK